MANSMGGIEITVLANIAQMVSDLGKAQSENAKAAKRFHDDWKSNIDSVSDAFKGLAAIAGIGLSLEGLREVAIKSMDAAEKVNNLSQSLGLSTQSIQTMGFAAGLVGGNLDTATQSLAKMERSGEQAAAGNKQAAEAFRALGVSANELPGLLKKPDELMIQLAENVSNLGDGSAKTAAIMQIFGKGGADIIPLLNELGNGYDKLRQKAEAFGVVLTDQEQSSLLRANEGLGNLKLAAEGAGNEFTIALVPAIVAITQALDDLASGGSIKSFFSDMAVDIGELVAIGSQVIDWLHTVGETIHDITGISASSFAGMGGDVVAFVQQSMDEWAQIKGFAEEVWISIKAEAQTQWAQIQNTASAAIFNISRDLAGLLDQIAQFAMTTGSGDMAAVFKAAENSVVSFAASLPIASVDLDDYSGQILKVQQQTNSEIAANKNWADGIRLTSDSLNMMTLGMDEFSSSLKAGDVAGNAKKLDDAIANLHDGSAQLIADGADAAKVHANESSTIDQLTKMVGKADAAQVHYNASISDGDAERKKLAADLVQMQKFLETLAGKVGGPYEKAWAEYSGAIDETSARANKFIADGMEVVKVQQFIADATALATERLREQTDADQILSQFMAKTITDLNEETRIRGLTGESLQVETEYTKLLAAANNELAGVMGPLTEAQQKELDSLHALAEQHVKTDEAIDNAKKVQQEYQGIFENGLGSMADAVGQFFTGQIKSWHDLGQSIIGSVKQMIAQVIAEYIKLKVLGPIIAGLFGSGAAYGMSYSGGASSIGGSAVGVAADFASTAAGATQSSILNPSGWVMAGKSLWNGFFGSGSATMGYQSNMFGSATNLGGSFGGSVYQPSGLGSAVGIAGGLYAGYNRYESAGGGATGVLGGAAYGIGTVGLAGIAGSMMLGGTAAAGMAGGMASIGLGAIPVVGWVALAAMAVDYLSGGKLFGTKGKLDSSQMTLDVGSAGVDLAESYTLKGQKALFGGTKYTTESVTPDAAAVAAAQAFFDSIQKNTDQFAKQFNAKVGDLVGGSFTQNYDKNGNPTTSTSTVLGQTYSGETQAQFGQRLIDENDLAILGQFDSKLGGMLDQFRGSVDTLTQVTTGLASAQMMLASGEKFLALGSDQSLSAVLNLAESMQASGETIDQTFARLEQAQQQYDQFVGQFKPAATYVDDFEAALSGVNQTMIANIAQANALAKAAGAEGASVEDLTNIHKYAISQFNALVAQLQDTAQSLAFNLGLTTTGSLDQVNAEIQRLQQQAGGGARAVQSFGQAMQTAAHQATDAMNLLLGDLSPLNDQEKLQKALEGLRAGTVTQDQVLQIGRRLYASSQAYNDLFAQVQGIGVISNSVSPTGSGSGAQGLSASDSERLQELLQEQATLQNAATLAQYQTLAQQVAELAKAKGKDYTQVLKDMGVKQADLEKGLGLKTDADLQLYIANVQKQTDSNNDNTTSIVSAILGLPQAIADAINGTNRNAGASSGNGRPIYTPPGRNLTDADAQAIGAAVADAVERRGNVNNRRNYAPALQP